jgi:hypothetical protein
MAGNDSGLCRLSAPVLAFPELRRVEKAPLNRARHPMHRALADLAGLSLHLELGGDLLQKLRPQRLIDRPGQAEQQVHFFGAEAERHGAFPGRGPGAPTIARLDAGSRSLRTVFLREGGKTG